MRRLQHNSSAISITNNKTSIITCCNFRQQLRFRVNTANRKTTHWQVSEIERENTGAARLRDLSRATVSQISNPRNKTELRISLQKAPTLAHYIESLDREDDTGYLSVGNGQQLDFTIHRRQHSSASPSSSSSLLPTSPVPIDSARATGDEVLDGPPSVESLLPWLEAPVPGKGAMGSGSRTQLREKTYLAQAQATTGRKELWAKTVSDPTRRRQLVDTLWSYINDADEQTREVERDAYRTFVRAKQNSEEFVYWIRKMLDEGEDAFWDWPDPDEVNYEERRRIQLAALNGNNNNNQQQLLLGGGAEDMSDTGKMLERQRLDSALLRRVERNKLGSAMVGGDISVDAPLAPYEDLPFLKMRMQENPDSLDPALKAWASQNLEITEEDKAKLQQSKKNNNNEENDEDDVAGEEGGKKKGSEGEENDSELLNEENSDDALNYSQNFAAAENNNNDNSYLKSVSTSSSSSSAQQQQQNVHQTREERARSRFERRLRKVEALRRLHLPVKHRVKMRNSTFDTEGVYFHVAPKELANLDTTASTSAFENKTSSSSSSIDDIVSSASPSSSSVKKSFFKPKMVKATDDISKGVVKIDWPTVRAAYAGKRATDYSREDQASARERIIRLCRGEDPNTL